LASGATKTEAKKGIEFKKKKKKAHMASDAPKTEAKRVSNLKKKKRSPYDLGWHRKPRPKGRALWPRVPLNRGRRGLYGFGS